MAKTQSTMLELGTKAPDFLLMNSADLQMVSRDQVMGEKGLLVIFMCNHCPYVLHILDKLLEVVKRYQAQGIGVVAISSNDIENYPDDRPEKMKELAELKKFSFPYLYDETQVVAKIYQAACTPDFFLFDRHMSLAYRGRFDSATPGNNHPITGEDLVKALECLVADRSVDKFQLPSLGCNIKWKA